RSTRSKRDGSSDVCSSDLGGGEELGGPAARPADAPAADVEDLHGGLQLVLGQTDQVGVGGVGEHQRVLLHDLGQGLQVIAQSREIGRASCRKERRSCGTYD